MPGCAPATTSKTLLYQSPDGQVRLEVQLDHDTVWLSQAQIVDLFNLSKKAVSEHINNVFRGGEITADSVVRDFRTTATDGKSYVVNYYNLDVIISVGYQVKSKQDTSFRQWATQVLRQYLVQGYILGK